MLDVRLTEGLGRCAFKDMDYLPAAFRPAMPRMMTCRAPLEHQTCRAAAERADCTAQHVGAKRPCVPGLNRPCCRTGGAMPSLNGAARQEADLGAARPELACGANSLPATRPRIRMKNKRSPAKGEAARPAPCFNDVKARHWKRPNV